MLEANHGHIVTLASNAGLVGVAGLVDYCASKFGAVGTDESIRFEIKKLGKTGEKHFAFECHGQLFLTLSLYLLHIFNFYFLGWLFSLF